MFRSSTVGSAGTGCSLTVDGVGVGSAPKAMSRPASKTEIAKEALNLDQAHVIGNVLLGENHDRYETGKTVSSAADWQCFLPRCILAVC